MVAIEKEREVKAQKIKDKEAEISNYDQIIKECEEETVDQRAQFYQ